LDALVTPVGGGGLLSGCAVIAKSVHPAIRVFGVEPEDGNDTALSRKAGQRVSIPTPRTIADGLRATRPGELTFPVIQALAEDVILVSDDEIRAAMRFLLTRMKILVEPSGAAPAAAVMFGKIKAQRIGVILSGGNVDLEFVGGGL
jgi:threonine dehydratase